ncbi:MAG TPA: tetratricopeptide repeat protein [Pyrinomonadaceae bacterium]|jgi:Flp pilus assembly protein TadD|nr:tetratricopeptide repeat protein [Pyrinomonadaceae bacterium]
MAKSTFASSLMAIFLVLALVPYHRIATAESFDWAALAAAEAAAEAGEAEIDQETTEATQKKKGSSFARALGAPFRALGRLFGGGSKKTESKKTEQTSARKPSAKDVEKFESAKVVRIVDARTEAPKSVVTVTSAPVEVHLQRGRELLNAGQVNEALAELTAAQAADPKSAELQNLLGVTYSSMGMPDRALKAFEAAVKADKDNAQYLNNYGFLLLKTSNFESAAKYLKRAAKLSPSDARIWNNLAVAQCQRGKFDDAYVSFVQAVGEFDARVNMAAQLLSQGMGQEAIKHLEVAHALRPNSIEVLTRLTGLYNMTGRISDAAVARRTLLALQTSAEVQK